MTTINYFEYIRDNIVEILNDLVASGSLRKIQNFNQISVEPARGKTHGDAATNVAMVLAKPSGLKPHDLAGQIVGELLKLDFV